MALIQSNINIEETSSGGSINDIFKDEIQVALEDENIFIAAIEKDENEERYVHFRMNKEQAQIVSDMLQLYIKQLD